MKTQDPLPCHSKAYLAILDEEQRIRDRLADRTCVGYHRDVAYDALERIVKRRKAYEQKVLETSAEKLHRDINQCVVYASLSNGFYMGYVDYYCQYFHQAATPMLRDYSDQEKDRLLNILYKERWHYAARLGKTHTRSIPVLVAWMKLQGIVKETIERFKPQPAVVQLTFDFD